MFARPPIGQLFFFVGKFLEFLKPFFQKGFKWVWAKPTTLPYSNPSTMRRISVWISSMGRAALTTWMLSRVERESMTERN